MHVQEGRGHLARFLGILTPMEVRLGCELEAVRRMALAALQPFRVRVFLFGSQLRGAVRHDSDIDVGVLPLAPLAPGILSRLREELEESNLLTRVDLVDLSRADEDFRARVVAHGLPWRD